MNKPPTKRQLEVLKTVWKTGSIKAAANELGVSARTIEAHLTHSHSPYSHWTGLRGKLNMKNGTLIDLCRWGVRTGLLAC